MKRREPVPIRWVRPETSGSSGKSRHASWERCEQMSMPEISCETMQEKHNGAAQHLFKIRHFYFGLTNTINVLAFYPFL